MLVIIVLIMSMVNYTNSQEVRKKIFLVGSSVEYGIPIYNSNGQGLAIQGEYLMSPSYGILLDYSFLKYKGIEDDISFTFTVSSPAIFICWHTPPESDIEMVIGAGVGYTTIIGNQTRKTTNPFYDNEPDNAVIPQLKLGVRYWFSRHGAVKINVGFYRLASLGFDYSI